MQLVKIWAERLGSAILSSFYFASRLLHFWAMVAVATMALLVVVHVCLRYIFREPLLFGEELAILVMFIVIFGAVPEIFVRGQHLRINIIADRLFPIKVRYWVEIVVTTLGLLFMGVFTCYFARLAIIFYVRNYPYEVMRNLPKWPVHMLISVSLAMVSIFMVISLLKLLKPGKAKAIQGKGEE